MPYIVKPKHPKTCYRCNAFLPRMNGHPPECWLGEKIEENNTFKFDGSYSVKPARGECYKPKSYREMMFVKDTFYDTGIARK